MKIIKNKKIWIVAIISLIVASIIIFLLVSNKEEKNYVESNYTAYLVSNNEKLLEIEFSESYYECVTSGKSDICSDITRKITTTNVLVNKIDSSSFSDSSLEKTIINFINILTEQENLEDNIIIISNYNFEKLASNIKENVSIDVYFDYQENLNSVDFEVPYYTITFETNGGNSIDSIVVKENEKITQPNEPIKEGYSFVGWYINDEKYNFEDAVKSNLTLTAKWEKSSSNSEDTSSSDTSSNSKINLNDNLSATIYYKSTGRIDCFFYMFVNNLNEIYPEVTYSNYANSIKKYKMWIGPEDEALNSEMTNSKFANSNLTYDTSKENKLKNYFEKYKNGVGIKVNSFSISDHKIAFDYEYITFNGLNVEDGTNANKEIENALNGSSLFQGTCGDNDYQENVIVDEQICTKYNLDCNRW